MSKEYELGKFERKFWLINELVHTSRSQVFKIRRKTYEKKKRCLVVGQRTIIKYILQIFRLPFSFVGIRLSYLKVRVFF